MTATQFPQDVSTIMAPRLTFKNITILGLIQVGAVVAGVRATGVTCKYWDTFGMQMTQATKLAAVYGPLALAVPVLWITIAFIIQHRNQSDDAPEAVTYLSGWVILAILLLGDFQTAVLPWVRLFSCSLAQSN